MISFQCSPLSTADGIVATFRQCASLQEEKNLGEFVAAVVLDEVGLAEDSPLMPLKVTANDLMMYCQNIRYFLLKYCENSKAIMLEKYFYIVFLAILKAGNNFQCDLALYLLFITHGKGGMKWLLPSAQRSRVIICCKVANI